MWINLYQNSEFLSFRRFTKRLYSASSGKAYRQHFEDRKCFAKKLFLRGQVPTLDLRNVQKRRFLKVGMVTFTSWSKISLLKQWHFRTMPLFVVKLKDSAATHITALSKYGWCFAFCFCKIEISLPIPGIAHASPAQVVFSWKKKLLPVHLPAIWRDLDVTRTYREAPHLCA